MFARGQDGSGHGGRNEHLAGGGGVVVTNLGEEAVPFVTSQTADFHNSVHVFYLHTFKEAEKKRRSEGQMFPFWGHH